MIHIRPFFIHVALCALSAALTACATASRSFEDGDSSSGDGGSGGSDSSSAGGTGSVSSSSDGGSSTTGDGGSGGAGGAGPTCGDGVVQAPETCDDGNTMSLDGCSDVCVKEVCGDGILQLALGEQCDDGNIASEDGCSDQCVTERCGDGVLQAGLGEQCDDGNTDAEDGCSQNCKNEYCGDGVLQPGLGEQCDDGNNIDADACTNTCTLTAVTSCVGFGTGMSALINPDFETGALAPWTNDANVVPTATSHTGAWAVESNGNHYIDQIFAPVPVSSLVKASFWTYHDAADSPAMSVEWTYSDNSTGSTFLSNQQLMGWVEVNILPLLTAGKSLQRIRVWGYSSGGALPDIARFDDFLFCY